MDRHVKSVISFIGVVIFLVVMKLCSSLIMPLMIAVFIFILVNPVMERMEKMHIPSPLAMIVVLLLVTCVCIIFVYLLFAMINMILAKLPEYILKVARFDEYISLKLRDIFNVTESQFPSQGRVIVEPNCISIQRVNDFLIGVKRYDKWALVDFSGKQITQPIYTSLTDILKEGWRANDFADKELEIQEAKELNKVEDEMAKNNSKNLYNE